MKIMIIFGPPAVGKMTVRYELQKRTGLRLSHRHMTVEPVLNVLSPDRRSPYDSLTQVIKCMFSENNREPEKKLIKRLNRRYIIYISAT